MKYWPIMGICIFIVLFFLSSAYFVHSYYQEGLPYYDSVGAYWNLFSVMNTTKNSGIWEGMRHAYSYPLSWLQSYFVVLTAWFLPKTPEALISLNFLCIGIFQLSIYVFFRNRKFSQAKSFLLTLVPVLPSAAVGWEGGLIDMRRDNSMYSLLGASFFLFWDYSLQPTRIKGILLGILTGFTQWSRGNALPYMILVLLPVCISWFFIVGRKHTSKAFFVFMLPVLSFFIVAGPFYYANAYGVYTKYVFGSWAFGIDRISAIKTYMQSLIFMFLGTKGEMMKITMSIIIGGFFFLYYGLRKNYIRFDHSNRQFPLKPFFFSSVLVLINVMVFNALLLGVSPIGGIFPHFPSLIGVVGIISAGGTCVSASRKNNISESTKILFVVFAAFGLLMLNFYRIYHTMPVKQPTLKSQAQQAAMDVANHVNGKPVAYLWLDHIHAHDLNFYITQQGGLPIPVGTLLAPGVDTEMPPNPSLTIEKQQEEFAKGVRVWKYIIVSENPNDYADPAGFFFILMHGKPVIEGLLQDTSMRTIYRFPGNDRFFIVLENTAV